jgi:hypothetical protein
MTSTPVTLSPPKVVLEVRETQDPETGKLSREMRSTKKHRLLLMLTNQMFDAVRRKACHSLTFRLGRRFAPIKPVGAQAQ